MTAEDALYAIYLIVGVLVGLRVGTVLAWRVAAQRGERLRREWEINRSKYPYSMEGTSPPVVTVPSRPDWSTEPGPFFALLGTVVAWPVTLLVVALSGRLFAPPRDMRDVIEVARLERENAELDRRLAETRR
jgi:hypothetical protein